MLKNVDRECFCGEEMRNTEPLRCQKCGKPLGYVTVLAKGLTGLPLSVQDVKLILFVWNVFRSRHNCHDSIPESLSFFLSFLVNSSDNPSFMPSPGNPIKASIIVDRSLGKDVSVIKKLE